jgi:CRP/FNR family transcriptional regulator
MNMTLDNRTKSLLRGVPYFKALDDSALETAAQEIITRHYSAGEIIFLEGDAGSGLHLVVQGLCQIYYLSSEGREYIVQALGPGDFCNEVSAVDGGPNPANMAAVQDSTVGVLSREALTRLRQQYPVLNEVIISNLAAHCRQLVQQVFNLSFRSVTGRLAKFLLEQAETSNELNRQHWTHEDIAAHLGTVREMVSRSFRELQEARLIVVNRHRIEIIDKAGLESLI